jgi:hypothetical protein
VADWKQWLIAGGASVLVASIAIRLGHALGKRATRAAPGLAMSLWFFNAFFKVDPPPPPKAERVHKSEEDAGAPPTT